MPSSQRPDDAGTLEGVNRVAWRALSTVLPQGGGSDGSARKPLETYLEQMMEASLHAAPLRLGEVVKNMRRARISGLQIAESYVPIVARRLGDAWLADTLDFSAVTIGAARLQGLLRRLGSDWDHPRGAEVESPPAYLVGVPEGVQHTLGAMVLAGQLRHRGLSVHLDLEMTPESLARQVRNERYSGVMISTSSLDSLESCRRLVACSKNESRGTPVIIGGIVLHVDEDIMSHTRADILTSDIYDALHFCDMCAATEGAGAAGLGDYFDRRAAE